MKKLDKNTQERIVQKITHYSSNPLHFARKLQDSRIGNYRFRIGDYRVIFNIESDQLIVLRVGDRKDIYK